MNYLIHQIFNVSTILLLHTFLVAVVWFFFKYPYDFEENWEILSHLVLKEASYIVFNITIQRFGDNSVTELLFYGRWNFQLPTCSVSDKPLGTICITICNEHHVWVANFYKTATSLEGYVLVNDVKWKILNNYMDWRAT